MSDRTTDVAVIGAGPIGIELAIALQRAGVDYLHFEAGQIGQTITWYPQQVHFFSSNDRLSLAGIPIHTVGQQKVTKEQYLAYLRMLVDQFDLHIRTYERVETIEPRDGGFRLRTRRADGHHVIDAARVVTVIGDMHGPRRLGIPGEDLPHVSHYFVEPHRYFQEKLLIVGGRNSAVEAALRCYHAGVDVTLSYRREALDPEAVKYWLLPELTGRIRRGEIACHYRTAPVEISPTRTTLRQLDTASTFEVEADFVLLLTGYEADMTLLRAAGVALDDTQTPHIDPQTMETNVPGLYVAGTATAGTQHRYRVFIENCHIHTQRIVAALTGSPPPETPSPQLLPES